MLTGVVLNCSIVLIPISSRALFVTFPMPHIFETGRGSRICCLFSSVIMTKPSGFSKSEASLARNLLGAIPTEAVRSACSLISDFIRLPIVSAEPNSLIQPVTSRNASSMPLRVLHRECNREISVEFVWIVQHNGSF